MYDAIGYPTAEDVNRLTCKISRGIYNRSGIKVRPTVYLQTTHFNQPSQTSDHAWTISLLADSCAMRPAHRITLQARRSRSHSSNPEGSEIATSARRLGSARRKLVAGWGTDCVCQRPRFVSVERRWERCPQPRHGREREAVVAPLVARRKAGAVYGSGGIGSHKAWEARADGSDIRPLSSGRAHRSTNVAVVGLETAGILSFSPKVSCGLFGRERAF